MFGMHKSIRLYLFLVLMIAVPAVAGDVAVATGDGIVVYSQDIDLMKAVYGESGFETTSKEYINAMLKVRLFAKEALELKLVDPLEAYEIAAQPMQPEMTKDRFQKLLQIYSLYVAYIYDHCPVSDAAIESYYLAFPEKTTMSGETSSGSGFFRPNTLDEEMKKVIRSRLMQNRKPGLLADEFKRLCEKNHVKVVSGY